MYKGRALLHKQPRICFTQGAKASHSSGYPRSRHCRSPSRPKQIPVGRKVLEVGEGRDTWFRQITNQHLQCVFSSKTPSGRSKRIIVIVLARFYKATFHPLTNICTRFSGGIADALIKPATTSGRKVWVVFTQRPGSTRYKSF